MKELFHLIGILNKNFGSVCSDIVLSHFLKNEIEKKEAELNNLKILLENVDNKRTKITKSWKSYNESV
jgi:succinate dehydrogenase flavin-adding protein (antitoxin of CptAB toxin-antitoxin module)